MRSTTAHTPLIFCLALLAPLSSPASVITGTVVGEGARPITGAVIEVIGAADTRLCATNSAADGTFSLPCAAIGSFRVRASFGELRPWEIDDVALAAESEVHLNFMLLPALPAGAGGIAVDEVPGPNGFWSRRLPNPVLTTFAGHSLTLRLVAIVVAAIAFVLGALTMFALGRRFGVEKRRLSNGEVGDMILNPHMPSAGERLTPVAVAGARGASVNVSYGADEIAAALASRRYGLVFTAVVIAPGLFALFSLGLAFALLAGHEMYLFCAMLLVPLGFLLTAIIIATHAIAVGRARP